MLFRFPIGASYAQAVADCFSAVRGGNTAVDRSVESMKIAQIAPLMGKRTASASMAAATERSFLPLRRVGRLGHDVASERRTRHLG